MNRRRVPRRSGDDGGASTSRSDEITAYFRMVAASSPRVRLETHGKTPEGRDLIHAVISSPANLAKYSQGQRPNDPNGPLILWLGYGVHGNEPSAKRGVASGFARFGRGRRPLGGIAFEPRHHHFGAVPQPRWPRSPRHLAQRQPGRQRDPRIRRSGKTEPWPGGRTSHYWVDLNRDWLPLTQIESATRHQVWRKWHPHLTLDFHEMGTPGYFFQPGVPTRVHPLTPPENQSLTRWFAGYHARALESLRETYFFEERFDDFYPGKGSTYPDLTGSIGILFEQANSRGLRGLVGGKELRYGEAVRNQVATTFSSLRASLEGEKKLKDYQIQFYKTRPEPAWAAAQFQWRVGETNGAKLIELLQQHGVEVLARREGEVTEVAIPMDQPESRLIQAMFERRTEFTDDQFYDISTWCFDLAYGLDMKFPGRFDRKGWQPMGDPATWWPQPRLAPLPEAYAYHLPGKGSGVPRAISALLQAGSRSAWRMPRSSCRGSG